MAFNGVSQKLFDNSQQLLFCKELTVELENDRTRRLRMYVSGAVRDL